MQVTSTLDVNASNHQRLKSMQVTSILEGYASNQQHLKSVQVTIIVCSQWKKTSMFEVNASNINIRRQCK